MGVLPIAQISYMEDRRLKSDIVLHGSVGNSGGGFIIQKSKVGSTPTSASYLVEFMWDDILENDVNLDCAYLYPGVKMGT